MTAKLDPYLVLASAVAEERISPSEFEAVLLPLHKHYAESFASVEEFELAEELFHVACDYCGEQEEIAGGLLGDEEVRVAAGMIAQKMRRILGR
ncbi:hypothetical protein [Streptomyces sp. NPDC005017]|uniref:hypothetical protein n=1 Tax=Streptomyces sp. NPDC005017 TaxID=3364706 RepID=UPI0036975CDA